MPELHTDISSAAAEIFAASVALNELLHLGYVTPELGLSLPQPIMLEVDNATIKSDAPNFVTLIVGKLGGRLCRISASSSLSRSTRMTISPLLNVVRFECVVNKTMVRKELPAPSKAAASVTP